MGKNVWLATVIFVGTSFLWVPPVLGPVCCGTILYSKFQYVRFR